MTTHINAISEPPIVTVFGFPCSLFYDWFTIASRLVEYSTTLWNISQPWRSGWNEIERVQTTSLGVLHCFDDSPEGEDEEKKVGGEIRHHTYAYLFSLDEMASHLDNNSVVSLEGETPYSDYLKDQSSKIKGHLRRCSHPMSLIAWADQRRRVWVCQERDRFACLCVSLFPADAPLVAHSVGSVGLLRFIGSDRVYMKDGGDTREKIEQR